MSFSINASGHTETQEEFEAVIEDFKAFVQDHLPALTYASLTGTDNESQSRAIDFLAVLNNGEDEAQAEATTVTSDEVADVETVLGEDDNKETTS